MSLRTVGSFLLLVVSLFVLTACEETDGTDAGASNDGAATGGDGDGGPVGDGAVGEGDRDGSLDAGSMDAGLLGDLDGSVLRGQDGGENASTDDAGAETRDGSIHFPPIKIFALPRDVVLATFAWPYTGDEPKEVSIDTSFHYRSTYQDDALVTDKRVFRFIARTYDASHDWPLGTGIRVWWVRPYSDPTQTPDYVCARVDTGNGGEYALTVHALDEETGMPNSSYINSCSWTLVKHPTEDKYALRVAYGSDHPEGGNFVSDVHATVSVGRSIAVKNHWTDGAPYFELLSPEPPVQDL